MISNKGFMEGIITLNCDAVLSEGEVVTFGGNNSIIACAPADPFLGIIRNHRNGIAAVQVKGYAKVKVTGTVVLGVVNIVCDGEGGITADSSGREVLVLSVDESTSTAEIIM